MLRELVPCHRIPHDIRAHHAILVVQTKCLKLATSQAGKRLRLRGLFFHHRTHLETALFIASNEVRVGEYHDSRHALLDLTESPPVLKLIDRGTKHK